ncbi:MAG: TRAM domain-containing protein [Spirochaetaceae bacterium]|nr:TRAM domain-containing protein [Spirochaetaceae bacterium]
MAYHSGSMAEETLTLTVQKLATGGDGIAFSDGRVIFIPLTIPGETVVCRIIADFHDYAKAELLEVIEPSPARVTPPCPIFGQCGGCKLQHISIERQRELKAESVRETFTRTAKFDPGPIPLKSGAPYGYRNRAELHFTGDHGIGFMVGESSASVRARNCPIVVQSIASWLHGQNRKAKPEREIRAAYGDRDRFTIFGQDERLYIEGRDATARATVAGQEYSFPVKHFFQSNIEMASALVEDVVEGVSGERAVDLYCGSGLFAKRLAALCGEIACVESDVAALEAARNNVKGRKVSFHARNAEEWVRSGTAGTAGIAGGSPIDWVTVDPPRTGLSAELRAWLSRADIGAINYVSCDPVTLARDLRELKDAGWQIKSLCLYDFYPQTGRIEAFARLVSGEERRKKHGKDWSL